MLTENWDRHEFEIQECRQQLKQALAEEKEIADEIERAKRVLQLERGAAARREKELEEMRAAHAREVAATDLESTDAIIADLRKPLLIRVAAGCSLVRRVPSRGASEERVG